MFRISKLTDYSTVVMSYLAREPDKTHNARDIMAHTSIALPTISKILKMLAKAGLLRSHRGMNGGYSLALLPTQTLVFKIHLLSVKPAAAATATPTATTPATTTSTTTADTTTPAKS
jgi:Rrf2 family protein